MKVLLDTSILLRLSEPNHVQHPIANESLDRLTALGKGFCIGSQTISEFFAVATRAVGDRGLGMSAVTAEGGLSRLISKLDVLYDSAESLYELRSLVVQHRIVGKSVHDAKLVATMNANGVKDILRFNGRDFGRYAGLNVIDPTTASSAGTDSANSTA